MLLELLAVVGVGALVLGWPRPVRQEPRTWELGRFAPPPRLPPAPEPFRSEGLPSGTREFLCEHFWRRDMVRLQRACLACGTTISDLEWELERR